MRNPPETHEQLISLQRLRLDDRPIEFRQGFLTIAASAWSCTLRGILAEELDVFEGELGLRAEALDGRTIEGRVEVSGSLGAAGEAPAVVELVGIGPVLVEGREL